ncbi:hypothetical protein JDN40_00860 [Rhodomicrobium vannielii ATCC 17100]|nr:hypothetical protein [Rhodomicrobium vannielii ATCC 17100]
MISLDRFSLLFSCSRAACRATSRPNDLRFTHRSRVEQLNAHRLEVAEIARDDDQPMHKCGRRNRLSRCGRGSGFGNRFASLGFWVEL